MAAIGRRLPAAGHVTVPWPRRSPARDHGGASLEAPPPHPLPSSFQSAHQRLVGRQRLPTCFYSEVLRCRFPVDFLPLTPTAGRRRIKSRFETKGSEISSKDGAADGGSERSLHLRRTDFRSEEPGGQRMDSGALPRWDFVPAQVPPPRADPTLPSPGRMLGHVRDPDQPVRSRRVPGSQTVPLWVPPELLLPSISAGPRGNFRPHQVTPPPAPRPLVDR